MKCATKPTYFVYLHRRPDTGEVFYVGKGTRTDKKQYIRANTTNRRNIVWRRIVAKAGGWSVEVLADFFLEADAFEMERSLITTYKRFAEGGTLCNITTGGEGHSGLSPSSATRLKMSKAAKGKPKSDHVRLAVSLAQRGVPNPVWQSEQHSLRMRGSGNPFFGKKREQSFVDRMTGGNHPMARKVTDGSAVYPTIGEAAKVIGVRRDTLSKWMREGKTHMRLA